MVKRAVYANPSGPQRQEVGPVPGALAGEPRVDAAKLVFSAL